MCRSSGLGSLGNFMGNETFSHYLFHQAVGIKSTYLSNLYYYQALK